MKYKKYLILFFALTIFAISGCGRKKAEDEVAEIAPKTVLEQKLEIEEETEEKAPEIVTYSVKLVGKTLALYEVNGENRRIITSMEINPEFYPKEDIEKLSAGVEAFCKEDGYEILENFAN